MNEQTTKDFEAWKAYDSKRRRYENQMEREAEKMFDEMERDVLKKLDQLPGA